MHAISSVRGDVWDGGDPLPFQTAISSTPSSFMCTFAGDSFSISLDRGENISLNGAMMLGSTDLVKTVWLVFHRDYYIPESLRLKGTVYIRASIFL